MNLCFNRIIFFISLTYILNSSVLSVFNLGLHCFYSFIYQFNLIHLVLAHLI